MTQISAIAGIKVGQIYRDFAGKEAIVADIVECDLRHFLNEPALDEAVATGDAAAVRRWIINLIQRDCDSAPDGLFPLIIVEAPHNAHIAALLHGADQRVTTNVDRALSAIAPGDARKHLRAELIEFIMVVLTGLSHRKLAGPETDHAGIAERCSAVVNSELDRLLVTPDC